MTKQEQDKLLEEAKLRYPPGTVIKSLIAGNDKTISNTFKLNYDTSDYIDISDNKGIFVYYKNKWAEIISKPEAKQPYNYVKSTKDNTRFKIGQIIQTFRQSDKEHFYYTLDISFSLTGRDFCFIPCDQNGNTIKGYSTSDLIIEDNKPSKDKPFYVVVTEENKEVLSKWRFDNSKDKLNIGKIVGLCLWNNEKLEKETNSANIIQGRSYTFGNEITFEQFLELYPEYKEDKPKYKVGKWYSAISNNYLLKFKVDRITDENIYFKDEKYINFENKYALASCIGIKNLSNVKEITDLSEIQQYLPDGHVDKVASIPDFSVEFWYNP